MARRRRSTWLGDPLGRRRGKARSNRPDQPSALNPRWKLHFEPLEDRRLLAAGSLDTTFNSVGWAATPIGAGIDVANAVAIQSDGKIVVAGGSGSTFALARYNANGSLDTTFDGDGKLTTTFGGTSSAAYGVAIQSDGKIVAAGYSLSATNNQDFALARYNTDGSLDTSFDGDGKLTTDFGLFFDFAFSVAIQADGKIVAAGNSGAGNTKISLWPVTTPMALSTHPSCRWQSDHVLCWGNDIAYSVAIQTDGKIVAAGKARLLAMANLPSPATTPMVRSTRRLAATAS